MKNNRVMVTTTSYNPDHEISRIRAEIAKRTFRNVLDRGCPIIAVDGGSPDELLKEFESYGVNVLPQEQKGMGNARRQAIRVAAYDFNSQATMSTEPEKDLSRFLDEIFDPLESGEADFVNLARRDMTSYPSFQQKTETLGNIFWKKITGVELDMFFGPRAWISGMEKYFLEYDGEKHDAIHVPVLDIIHAGHRVKSVEVDFSYPREQREVEERSTNNPGMMIKRLGQLYDLSKQTMERWKYLKRVIKD